MLGTFVIAAAVFFSAGFLAGAVFLKNRESRKRMIREEIMRLS